MSSPPHEYPGESAALSPPDELAIERVRRSVARQIAEASTLLHLTIAPGPAEWQPFLQGITIKVLHASQDSLSYLLRLDPGAVLPAHRHPQDEECIVLEGELRIGDQLLVPQGAYHLARAGAFHADISSPTGALIFLRGAEPTIGHSL